MGNMKNINAIRFLKLNSINEGQDFTLKKGAKYKFNFIQKIFYKGYRTIDKLILEYDGILTGPKSLNLQEYNGRSILGRKPKDWDIIMSETMYNKAVYDGVIDLNDVSPLFSNFQMVQFQRYGNVEIDILIKKDVDIERISTLTTSNKWRIAKADYIYIWLDKMGRYSDINYFYDKFSYII